MHFHCTSQSLGLVESLKKCWKHLFVFLKLMGGILETVCAFSLDFSKCKTSKLSYKILKTWICIYKFGGRGILQRRCAFSLHFSKFMTYAILKTLEGIEAKCIEIFMRKCYKCKVLAGVHQIFFRKKKNWPNLEEFIKKVLWPSTFPRKYSKIWKNSSKKCNDPALFIENIAKSRDKSFINA